MTFSIVPVILCGGSGTRLWPLSRTAFPKQFLTLSKKGTLFQQTIQRLQHFDSNKIQIKNTLIVTNEEHRFLVLDQIKDLKIVDPRLILEPIGRDTAPALALAALEASQNDNDPILVVVSADQAIRIQDKFVEALQDSIEIAAKGAVVILGIKPDYPSTGFGYIKKAGLVKIGESDVIEFKEKPDLETAQKYLDSGNYDWNGGMFVMRASVWLNCLKIFEEPLLNKTIEAYQQKTEDNIFIRPHAEIFKSIAPISIDYAVLEKLPNSQIPIKAISIDVGWNDMGSWDAVWEAEDHDENGNVQYGDALLKNTSNSLIYASDRLVVTSGIKDLVVIETADSVLVLDRHKTQDVKLIVAELELQKREEHNLHRKVLRPWGWFDTLDEEPMFKVKRICVNPHESLSLQKHKHRAEHWVVVKGKAEIQCGDKIINLEENQSTYIPKGEFHRLSNPFDEPLEIVEIQSGNYLGEDDIERIEDKYGR